MTQHPPVPQHSHQLCVCSRVGLKLPGNDAFLARKVDLVHAHVPALRIHRAVIAAEREEQTAGKGVAAHRRGCGAREGEEASLQGARLELCATSLQFPTSTDSIAYQQRVVRVEKQAHLAMRRSRQKVEVVAVEETETIVVYSSVSRSSE